MTQSSTNTRLYLLVVNYIPNVTWLRQTHGSVEGRLSTGQAIKISKGRHVVYVSMWLPCHSVTRSVNYTDIDETYIDASVGLFLLQILRDLDTLIKLEVPLLTPLVEFNDDCEGSM